MSVDNDETGVVMINNWRSMLSDGRFWQPKMRIAVLTLATFIALC